MRTRSNFKLLWGRLAVALCWCSLLLLSGAEVNPHDESDSSASTSTIPLKASNKMEENADDHSSADQDSKELTFSTTLEVVEDINHSKESIEEYSSALENEIKHNVSDNASSSTSTKQDIPVFKPPEFKKESTKHSSSSHNSNKQGSKPTSPSPSPQKARVSVRGAVASTFNQIGKETGVVVQQTTAATRSHWLLRFVFVMVLLSVLLVIFAMLSNTNLGGWVYIKSTEVFRRRHKELKDGVRSGSAGGDITWEWLKSAPDENNRYSSRTGSYKPNSRLQ